MIIARCSGLFFSIVLMGCTVGPTYEPPQMDIPCEWHSPLPEDVEVDACSEAQENSWWGRFNDPILNSLIERAACQNLDLSIAVARILLVRSEKKAKSAEGYPRIDFSANAGHLCLSKEALDNVLLDNVKCKKKHVNRNFDFFELGFDADWEIDLFGFRKREVNALEAEVEAAEESFKDIWVSLSAEIARTYIELRGQQGALALLNRNLEGQQKAIGLNADLVQGGVISELEASLSANQLNTLAAQKPTLELSISKSIHHLSVLLGTAPGVLFDELMVDGDCGLPDLPEGNRICVPSELLRQRPDIRQAERRLAAATERIGAAIANLFPRFSLRGFIGDISTHVGSIFTPASATWLAGPQLLLPIFNSKLIVQDIDYNKILTQKALYEYQKVVLAALEEAENAIAAYQSDADRSERLLEVFQGEQRSLELTRKLFEVGAKNNLDVLTATRALIDAENTYRQSLVNQLLNYIALYKALGGSPYLRAM